MKQAREGQVKRGKEMADQQFSNSIRFRIPNTAHTEVQAVLRRATCRATS
jgi:hypothetical protein